MTINEIKNLRKSLEKIEYLERTELLKDHYTKHRLLRLELIEQCESNGHSYTMLPRIPGKTYGYILPMTCRYCHHRVEYDRVKLTYKNQE